MQTRLIHIYVYSIALSVVAADNVVVRDSADFLDLCVKLAETIGDTDPCGHVVPHFRARYALIGNVHLIAAVFAVARSERIGEVQIHAQAIFLQERTAQTEAVVDLRHAHWSEHLIE